MGVFDFCGSWSEVPDAGDSLEPMMRTTGVAEDKIKQSLAECLLLEVSIRFGPAASSEELVTVYRDSSNVETSTTFELNGKWKLSHHRLSKCFFSHSTLTLEKQVGANLFLRDERVVERVGSAVFMRQHLSLYPKRPQADFTPLQANRLWKRVDSDSDFDPFIGEWELNRIKSQSLDPFLHSLGVTKPTLASTCVRQQVHLCGPRQLVFISHSSNPAFPPQRFLYSFQTGSGNKVIHSPSTNAPQLVIKADLAREGRSVNNSTGEMTQLLFHPSAQTKILRYWINTSNQTWIDTLPVLKPLHTVATTSRLLQALQALSIPKWKFPSVTPLAGWIAIRVLMVMLCLVLHLWKESATERELVIVLSLLLWGAIRADLFTSVQNKWAGLGMLAAACTTMGFTTSLNSPDVLLVCAVLPGVMLLFRVSIMDEAGYFISPPMVVKSLPPPAAPVFSLTVPKVRISQGGFGEYLIQVEETLGEPKQVWKRYREFDSFRNEKLASDPSTVGQVPFPGKTWGTHLDPVFLEQRRQRLESFLQAVVDHPTKLEDHATRAFLRLQPA
ncbi:hypothetical protein BASA81_003127 [Batrachochytrium salamandrivorans]|nr:hypothetical protein BASA81_003127 [Batrachochytrium salamandrivorans]